MTSPNVEAEVNAVVAGYWLLREYEAELAEHIHPLTYEAWSNQASRLGWLIDHLGKDVEALADAVWGKGGGAERLAYANSEAEAAADLSATAAEPAAGREAAA